MTTVKSDVLHGTLDLIILKTLESMGPLHGYAIARRIEQISSDQLAINQGTLYPALVKLGDRGWISTKWGQSHTGRRVKFYAITPKGQRQLHAEEDDWRRAADIVTKFFRLSKAARARAVDRFADTKIVPLYEAYYDEIIGRA